MMLLDVTNGYYCSRFAYYYGSRAYFVRAEVIG